MPIESRTTVQAVAYRTIPLATMGEARTSGVLNRLGSPVQETWRCHRADHTTAFQSGFALNPVVRCLHSGRAMQALQGLPPRPAGWDSTKLQQRHRYIYYEDQYSLSNDRFRVRRPMFLRAASG